MFDPIKELALLRIAQTTEPEESDMKLNPGKKFLRMHCYHMPPPRCNKSNGGDCGGCFAFE